jgi:hypothetical protein
LRRVHFRIYLHKEIIYFIYDTYIIDICIIYIFIMYVCMYIYIYIYNLHYLYIYIYIYICYLCKKDLYTYTHTKCQHLRNSEISFATALVRTLCWCAFLGTLSRAESLFCQGQRQHGDARAQICGTSYCTLHVQVRVRRQGQKAVPSNVSCSTDATPARSALS